MNITWDLHSNFHAVARSFFNFCQSFVWLQTFRQIPSNFPAVTRSVNFRQLSVWSQNLPSTFHALPRCSVNSVNFRADGRPSFNFCQLLCGCEAFHQLLLTFCSVVGSSKNFCAVARPSVSFLCSREIFCQPFEYYVDHPSTFCMVARPSFILFQHIVQSRVLPSTSIKFPLGHKIFCQLPQTQGN